MSPLSAVAATLFFVCQLFGCLSPVPIPLAFAATETIKSSGTYVGVTCITSSGEVVTHVDQSVNYLDSSGVKYKCVNPGKDFTAGSFTERNIENYLSASTIQKLGLATYWCEKKIGGDTGDIVAQIIVWRTLVASKEVTGVRSSNWVMDGYDSDAACKRFEDWYAEYKDKFIGHGTYWTHGDTQPVCRFWATRATGEAKALKRSTRTDMTDGNDAYSVSGATWGIWRDEACTDRLSSKYNLVADEKGVSNTVELPWGTYWVRETKAPRGFLLDETPHELVVNPNKTTTLELADEPLYATPGLVVTKRDSKRGDVAQGAASLAGAEFALDFFMGFHTEDDLPKTPTKSWVFRSDGSGNVRFDKDHKVSGDDFYMVDGKPALPLGTLTIREKTAPVGYLLERKGGAKVSGDAPLHIISVDGPKAKVSANVENEVIRGGVHLEKIDVDLGYSQAQGDASLAGVKFTIFSRNDLPIVIGSNTYTNGQAITTIETNEDGVAETAPDLLPYGSYLVIESGAPTGYLRNAQWKETFSIEEDGVVVQLSSSPCADQSIRGGVRLSKIDRDRKAASAQGDATLEGARFAIVLKSRKPVKVDGTVYTTGQTVKTIQTNQQGVATTGKYDLPFGTYEIHEEQPPTGYLLNESYSHEFAIRNDGEIVDLATDKCEDEVVRGGLAIGKVSRETLDHLPQGDTSLAQATFTVTLDSAQPVLVDGSLVESGGTACILTTDEDGYAATDAHYLPYGTYTIRETEAPRGYLLNDTWSSTVEIREDGVIVDRYPENLSADDQVVRGGFHFNKVDEQDMARLAGAVFRVSSMTTGETHILVADENGIVDTEQEAHSLNTNANDFAVDGEGIVDEDALVEGCGVWFSGRTDREVPPDDGLSALPYDTYLIEELPTSVNENHKLVSFSVKVHKHGHEVDMGTVDDKRDEREDARIGTSLTFDRTNHVAPSQESVELVDVVSYTGLEPGVEYRLEGELMDKATGEPVTSADGSPLTASTTFVAPLSAGTAEVRFILDTRSLGGSSLVAFESLYEDGREIAGHRDLDDVGQTVSFPSLATSLTDEEGGKEISASDEVVLIDTVSYEGLQANRLYEVVGTLMDKETGSPLVSSTGEIYRGTSSFVPDQAQGSLEVRFTIPGEVCAGHTLVAFEELRRSGTVLAQHADLEDEGQTVRVPRIKTTLTDVHGHHAIEARGNVELVDTVTYEGLTPGVSYTLKGTLYDKDTGKELVEGKGGPITAEATFTAENPSGTASVTFTCDSSLLVGKSVVAFEELHNERRVVAVHADLNDAAQTAHFPSIGTIITDAAGTHEVPGSEKSILTDVVRYEGVQPGVPLSIQGTLMDTETGKNVYDQGGEPLVATTEFTPTSHTGEAEVVFEVDTARALGSAMVAFETLREGAGENARVLARHEDLANREQTVWIPRIATTASDAKDGDKTLSSTATMQIRDTVTYENLEDGASYIMRGTLYDKATGNPLCDKDGKPYTAETPFEASGSGTVTLDFELPKVGKNVTEVVVFESCMRDEREVATHADLNDANQTLHIEHPESKKKPQSSPSAKGREARTPRTGDVLASGAGIVATAAAAIALGAYLKRHDMI